MKKKLFNTVLILIIFEALLTGVVLSSRYIAGSGILQSGFHTLDLIFLFGIAVIIAGASSLLLISSMRTKILHYLNQILENKNWLAGIFIFLCLICYEMFQDYLFLRSDMPSVLYFQYREILQQSFPMLILIFLGSFQFLLFVILLKWDLLKTWIKKKFQVRGTVIFLSLLFVFFLMNFSGYGFIFGTEDAARAHTMNAPLLGIQVGLIAGCLLGGGWLYGLVIKKWPKIKTYLTAEIVVVLGIWILTLLSWNASPLGANYFIDVPRSPNYEFYPSSDQLKYDIQALDLLNGGGMRPNALYPTADYIQHPMHSLYLAVLHAISGKGYEDILFLQIMVLSFIPVLLYKLGSLIHTRFSGLVISLLYLIRERNAIFLGEHITVSNVKTLMTEPLALLVFLVFLYLLLLWMRSENQKPWLMLLAGGVFGALLLIRIEVLAMIPAMGIVILFYFWRQWLVWLRGVGMAGLSIMIMITPWMIRNYQVEGRLELDKSFYIRWIFNQYMDYFSPDQDGDEDSTLHNETQIVEFSIAGKKAVSVYKIADGWHSVPGQTESPTSYFLDHFVNSIQQTIYYLPNNHQPLLTVGSLGDLLPGTASEVDLEGDQFLERYLERYVKGVPYWNFDWDGRLIARSYLPFMVTLGLISYGLSQLKKDRIWIPILLLLLILTQSAVYAVLSGSGGRSISIVDWISMIFFGIGLSGLLSNTFLLINGPEVLRSSTPFSMETEKIVRSKRNRNSLLVVSGIILAGMLLPLSEILIPSPYTEAALEMQMDLLKSNSAIAFPLEDKDGVVILYGKALYPRFYKAENRMDDDRRGIIPDYSYKRIEFYLVGTQNAWVTLPLMEKLEYFPHGSDVLIVADLEKGEVSPEGQRIHGAYYKSRVIYILNPAQTASDPISLFCAGEECLLDTER